MAILGLGTDIVEIARINEVFNRYGDSIAHRILYRKEFHFYKQNYHPVHFLAKRFAVKEAVSKALGMGISNGLAFKQLEVFSNPLGKPNVKLHKNAENLAQEIGVKVIHVSLTDERCYACATVIIES